MKRSLVFSAVFAAAFISSPSRLVSQSAGPRTHVLVVTGLGGEPEYSALFRTQALTFLDAARDRWGLSEQELVWLAEDPMAAPGRIAEKGTREAVQNQLASLATRAGPDDAVLILFIGHGSESGEESKVNLPGPDVSGADVAGWLAAFPTQTVAIVNAASASGGFVPALKGARRLVITATRTTGERWRTHFATFFVDAFALDGADVDKDDRVSLLEAFVYAKVEVERYYELDGQIPTEHALLDDNGDGEGSLDPTANGPDGAMANRFFLAAASRAVAAQAASDPELAALLRKKSQLEEDIATLRARRDQMEASRYEAALEALLLDLAVTSRSIRTKEGRPR